MTTPTAGPRLWITGLAQKPLELTWFDDRKGRVIGQPTTATTGGSPNVQVPDTVGGGFGKSAAFLIQPVGFTPATSLSSLPDAPIGQIIVSPTYRWHDECPETSASLLLTLTATTRPVPSGDYVHDWYIGDPVQRQVLDGGHQITHQFGPGNRSYYNRIKVDIKNQQGQRVSGDIVYVYVR